MDPQFTVRDLAATLEISIHKADQILNDELGLSRVCCRWVPNRLTEDQMDTRITLTQQLLQRRFHEGLDFLRHIITGDECWVYFYDPETKQQSSVWKAPTDPTPTKPKTCRAERKMMHIIFFDQRNCLQSSSATWNYC